MRNAFHRILDRFKTQETCNKAVEVGPWQLMYVPNHFKTQEMCKKTVDINPSFLRLIPDHLRTQEMRNKAVYDHPCILGDVPDHFKTQEMCNEAVGWRICRVMYVPDWFITQQQIDLWHDDDYCHDSAYIIKWYNGYQKRKAQKAKIKEELLPITWHPDRMMDWCMSEGEKKETEKSWK